jgi:hypothetical protein
MICTYSLNLEPSARSFICESKGLKEVFSKTTIIAIPKAAALTGISSQMNRGVKILVLILSPYIHYIYVGDVSTIYLELKSKSSTQNNVGKVQSTDQVK